MAILAMTAHGRGRPCYSGQDAHVTSPGLAIPAMSFHSQERLCHLLECGRKAAAFPRMGEDKLRQKI